MTHRSGRSYSFMAAAALVAVAVSGAVSIATAKPAKTAKPANAAKPTRAHRTHRTARAHTGASTPVVQAADASLVSALGAFRRQPGALDAPPAAIRGVLAASAGLQDVNPDLARAVGPQHDLYVMPGAGQFCVGKSFSPGAALYCSDERTLAAGQFVGAVSHVSAGYETTGLVGDGATDVVISGVESSSKTAVVDGAIDVVTTTSPAALTWRDSAGASHSQALGAP